MTMYEKYPSHSDTGGTGVLFYKEGDNMGFFRVDIKGLDTLEKDYNEEETNIKKQIPKALGIVGNEMVNNLQEHVTKDVYDKYEPYVYERRIGRTGQYAPIESQEYIDYNLSDNTLTFSYEPQGAHWVERWSNKHNGDNLIVSIQTGDLAGNAPPRPYWNRFVSEMENGGILSSFATGMKPYTLQTEGKDVVFAGNESMLEAQGNFTSDDDDWELPF